MPRKCYWNLPRWRQKGTKTLQLMSLLTTTSVNDKQQVPYRNAECKREMWGSFKVFICVWVRHQHNADVTIARLNSYFGTMYKKKPYPIGSLHTSLYSTFLYCLVMFTFLNFRFHNNFWSQKLQGLPEMKAKGRESKVWKEKGRLKRGDEDCWQIGHESHWESMGCRRQWFFCNNNCRSAQFRKWGPLQKIQKMWMRHLSSLTCVWNRWFSKPKVEKPICEEKQQLRWWMEIVSRL